MINDIKAKLPSKKKAVEEDELDENEGTRSGQDATDPTVNLSDKTGATSIGDLDEEEYEEEAPKSLVDKLKAKFAPKKKAAAADDDDEDVKKKPAKKKINPVVLVAVLGGLGLFLFYEEEPEVQAPIVNKPAYKKTLKDPAAKPTETPAGETPTGETPTDPAATVTETTPAETPAETPSETPVEPTITDTPAPVDSTITEPTIEEPTEPTITEPTTEPTTTPTEPVIDEPVITDTPVAPESVDSVDGQMPTDETSMTDKILEDLEKQVKKDQPKEVKKEYVAPPDYEYKGRGLVYNCAGKHWACVDAPSYKSCEDNYSSVTFKKKTIECYPFNVYESTRGCEAMQNRVVSSNAKTTFCKGN